MSREREEKEPREIMPGAPPVQMQMSSDVFLMPTEAPEKEKSKHYYVLSPLIALGNFEKGHELCLIGSGWLQSWVERIEATKMEDKIKAIELFNTVVGQSSRSKGRGTEQALLTQRMVIEERKPQQKGFLDRLFGR